MNAAVDKVSKPLPVFSQSWKYALVSCGIALLAILIAFWSTYVAIVEIWWRSETFAHGFIILPIVGFLIWRKRNELLRLTPEPAPIALVPVFAATFLWLLGYSVDIAVAQHVAAVALIPSMIWLCMGTQVARNITFPLLYIFFAAPFGDFLMGPLQDVTAAISVWLLQLTGIPVYWEGRFLHIPSGDFEVAQACSGIRYLIASLALGTLYAYLTYKSYWRRLIFIILSLLIPIIANGLRAYGIIMLAHLSDYKLAVGFDHIIYGWIFFGIVIFALLWVGSFFRDTTTGDNSVAATDKLPKPMAGLSRFAAWAVVSIVLATSSPVIAAWLDSRESRSPIKAIFLPKGENGWSGPAVSSDEWTPKFAGAVHTQGVYRKGNLTVDVYLAYYYRQVQGAELIGWNNAVYDSKNSKRLGGGKGAVQLGDGSEKWPVNYMNVTSGDSQRLIWYWYEIDGKPTTNRITAKYYEMLRRLSASKKGSAALLLSSSYEISQQEASDALNAFLADMLPSLREVANQ